MKTQQAKEGQVIVTCPDWRTRPMSPEAAQAWIERVETLAGGCRHEHTIEEAW